MLCRNADVTVNHCFRTRQCVVCIRTRCHTINQKRKRSVCIDFEDIAGHVRRSRHACILRITDDHDVVLGCSKAFVTRAYAHRTVDSGSPRTTVHVRTSVKVDRTLIFIRAVGDKHTCVVARRCFAPSRKLFGGTYCKVGGVVARELNHEPGVAVKPVECNRLYVRCAAKAVRFDLVQSRRFAQFGVRAFGFHFTAFFTTFFTAGFTAFFAVSFVSDVEEFLQLCLVCIIVFNTVNQTCKGICGRGIRKGDTVGVVYSRKAVFVCPCTACACLRITVNNRFRTCQSVRGATCSNRSVCNQRKTAVRDFIQIYRHGSVVRTFDHFITNDLNVRLLRVIVTHTEHVLSVRIRRLQNAAFIRTQEILTAAINRHTYAAVFRRVTNKNTKFSDRLLILAVPYGIYAVPSTVTLHRANCIVGCIFARELRNKPRVARFVHFKFNKLHFRAFRRNTVRRYDLIQRCFLC